MTLRFTGHKTIMTLDIYLIIVLFLTVTYTRFLFEVPKGLKVLSHMTYSQESENQFLMIIKLDIRPEFLLQIEVPPYNNGPISRAKNVHWHQVFLAP